MQKVLQNTGIALIIMGIIFSLTQISSLNEERKDMVYWKEAAEENYDNNLIEEKYLIIRDMYITHLTITLASLGSVVFSGIFFLALAKIISLLELIKTNTTKKTKDDELV